MACGNNRITFDPTDALNPVTHFHVVVSEGHEDTLRGVLLTRWIDSGVAVLPIKMLLHPLSIHLPINLNINTHTYIHLEFLIIYIA